ncbi:hypothetical protein ACFE04_023435 [Oxalis oulophora]
MAYDSTMKLRKLTLVLLMLIALNLICVSSFEFEVGGKRGWTKPVRNETGAYNFWATKHRFHIGDILYFKYHENDSVLVVNKTSYKSCILSNPIATFKGGNTTFQFDRYGYFYFISGQNGHCKAGQKLIVRVMVHPLHMAPQLAPSPNDGGSRDGWGPSNWLPDSVNSSGKGSVASYMMTALGAMMVILYSFA